MLQVLDAAALRQWCAAGLEALTTARQEIDDLNVYPVPDGDTGTNLQLTMAAVLAAVTPEPMEMAPTVRAMVLGSLMGARGNSGIILSQLLRGVGEILAPLEAAGPEILRLALLQGATSAYDAVSAPVEGTMLTVARMAAEAAQGADLAAMVCSARAGAAAALARTPEQLPALKAAGVVDAGGRGWCVLLEALEQVVTGTAPLTLPAMLVPREGSGLTAAREAGSDAFAYEVQFLLREATSEHVAVLKDRLHELGDSVAVVGGDGLYNVHVHVNDVGAAVEAGVDAGRPSRISVTRFADQIAAEGPRLLRNERPRGRAVIAVVQSEGLAALFRESGAQVVAGGPTSNPSTVELLRAVRESGAGEVVLLPNDGNVQAVAAAAAEHARLEGLAVAVVPTRSVLQGLAAASVADGNKAFDDDAAAMGAAAGATRWAEVTSAARASETAGGRCVPGDVLGLMDGEVALVGSDVVQVACDLLHRLLEGGGELATVVVGAQADVDAGERLTSYLSEVHPAVEVLVLYGGQPHYPLLLGVE
ncbi:MAG: Dak phosphatase [Frankiales bacterium]|nr:Dak phosphatase [Frankiales bacterium]